MNEMTIIGRAERVALPDLEIRNVPAKVDTGADLSSIWVSQADMKSDGLHCVFFAEGSPYYSGKVHIFKKSQVEVTRVSNSFGDKEIRYRVKLRLKVKGRLIHGSFTLADRSSKLYPILIGSRLLRGKFLVDVRKGNPLKQEEKKRRQRLIEDLEDMKKGDSV